MKTGNPIFKIHKIQHFVTIFQESLSEIYNLHKQKHFVTKAYDWRIKFIQKWTLFLDVLGRYE